jgi:hypothetical protein
LTEVKDQSAAFERALSESTRPRFRFEKAKTEEREQWGIWKKNAEDNRLDQ